MSEETLKIADQRREVKGKGEKERYTHLNGEFQRVTRNDLTKVKFITNSCEKKRSENQRRKGKIYPFECRLPKNSKERRKSSSVISAKK